MWNTLFESEHTPVRALDHTVLLSIQQQLKMVSQQHIHTLVPLPLYPTHTVPSGAPRGLTVQNSSANSLSVSWERPEERDVNGVLTEYIVEYFIVNTSDNQTVRVNGSTLVAELVDLNNYTVYSVSVSAVTVGVGPNTTATERTSENGSYTFHDSNIIPHFSCSAWGSSTASDSHEQLLNQC